MGACVSFGLLNDTISFQRSLQLAILLLEQADRAGHGHGSLLISDAQVKRQGLLVLVELAQGPLHFSVSRKSLEPLPGALHARRIRSRYELCYQVVQFLDLRLTVLEHANQCCIPL